jgi:hypothetical protein
MLPNAQDYTTNKTEPTRAPVAHACNPSYSGGRDQENHSSKPAKQIVRKILSQKNLSQKKWLVEWLKV